MSKKGTFRIPVAGTYEVYMRYGFLGIKYSINKYAEGDLIEVPFTREKWYQFWRPYEIVIMKVCDEV